MYTHVRMCMYAYTMAASIRPAWPARGLGPADWPRLAEAQGGPAAWDWQALEGAWEGEFGLGLTLTLTLTLALFDIRQDSVARRSSGHCARWCAARARAACPRRAPTPKRVRWTGVCMSVYLRRTYMCTHVHTCMHTYTMATSRSPPPPLASTRRAQCGAYL